MSEHYDVVIVGAGQSGAQAAISLRQAEFSGSIALVGEEKHLPYERPPLSKDYLAGERPMERLLLRPESFWQERNVTMILGEKIIAVDAQNHRLTAQSGRTITYGKLIWSAGGHPRPLPFAHAGLRGVHPIRTIDDSDALRRRMETSQNIIIIGGGYIGLEAAAVLSKAGKKVILLEALDRVLARVAGEAISRFYEQEHRAHGVDVRLGVKIDDLVGEQGEVTAVRLADGTVLACDTVIYGIGIIPAVEPLVKAGAKAGNGVEVDAYCRTSLSDIYAIGDCAAHCNKFAENACIRLESVQNGVDQAKTVAQDIMGAAQPYAATPWFWSNQYDLRLQTVGLSTGHDATVMRGDPQNRSFTLIYLKNGRVIALDCINNPKDFVQGKALVEQGLKIEPALLADSATPLKALLG